MPLAVRLGPATVLFTTRADGDVRRAPGAWRMVRQVHGAGVVTVDAAAPVTDGIEADALVTAEGGIALAVKTADCASVAFVSDEKVVGVAHAGWRGLMAGVLAETLTAMRTLGATNITAALGACIGPECYEFSPRDLDVIADRFGAQVRARTTTGAPALDLAAAVRTGLEDEKVPVVHQVAACTACDATRWFSHRARGEGERQATVVRTS